MYVPEETFRIPWYARSWMQRMQGRPRYSTREEKPFGAFMVWDGWNNGRQAPENSWRCAMQQVWKNAPAGFRIIKGMFVVGDEPIALIFG